MRSLDKLGMTTPDEILKQIQDDKIKTSRLRSKNNYKKNMPKQFYNPTNPSVSESEPQKKERQIYKIVVDRDLCIGAANCVAIAPESFKMDNENIAVIVEHWDDATDETIIQAAESCPTKAVLLFDKEGKQVYP